MSAIRRRTERGSSSGGTGGAGESAEGAGETFKPPVPSARA
jgi:hypothetical protein